MRHYLSLLFSLAILVMTACNGPSLGAESTQKKQVIAELYKTIQGFKSEGIPQKSEVDSITPFLSSHFKEMLTAASEREKQHKQNMTEPEPPLIEGNLFCSLFEGYTSVCKIWEDSTNKARFNVKLSYLDTNNILEQTIKKTGNQVVWVDRVTMVFENNHWVVDDIELLGNWEFGSKGSVKDILANIAKIQ